MVPARRLLQQQLRVLPELPCWLLFERIRLDELLFLLSWLLLHLRQHKVPRLPVRPLFFRLRLGWLQSLQRRLVFLRLWLARLQFV